LLNFTAGWSDRQRRRARLALGIVIVAALILAMGAALGRTGLDVALDGCLALALLAAISYALVNTGLAARVSDPAFVSGEMAAAFLLLAWLSGRAGEVLTPLPALYVLVMLYGMLQLDRTWLAALAAVGLVAHGTGLCMLIDRGGKLAPSAAWTQILALLLAYAWMVYAAGAILRLRERLSEARRNLHDLALEAGERASRDALTGVYQQRHMMEALEREIARAERIGKPLSVARVDLDGLGGVNAAHGPAAGDVALRRFTLASSGALRDVDILGRQSGKEFLAILPDTDLKGAVIAAERLRAAVGREPLPEVNGRRHLSCTLGVAEHRKGENTRLLIARAEAGLNFAKAAGRDRVVALDADGTPLIVETP
jgi:diguanylate cyclase (GGDEF)-like protein